jgi:hypothetical protein
MGNSLNDFLHMDELLESHFAFTRLSLVHPLFHCVLDGDSYIFVKFPNVLNYFSIFNVGKSSLYKQGCQHPFLDGYHQDVSQTSRHPLDILHRACLVIFSFDIIFFVQGLACPSLGNVGDNKDEKMMKGQQAMKK